jgi:hypothetical protein
MRDITPSLTPELERHTKRLGIVRAKPYVVDQYHELVRHIARLAYLNKDHLLFYRGQGINYRNKADGATFYPSIYRGDQLERETVEARFRLLERKSRRLRELFSAGEIDGHTEVARKRLIQWSILQHYGVSSTPLIDFTHSIRVACSFAQAEARDHKAFVFVFGLPYITNRISSNSEHDLVLIRLLSICPPAALRPYFQEGYLAGTTDVTTEYEDKNELDFNRRVIAQFEIPANDGFWGANLSRVADDELFPPEDSVKDICDSIDVGIDSGPAPNVLGAFVSVWTSLEQLILSRAQQREERVLTLRHAIEGLRRRRDISQAEFNELTQVRELRNRVVHGSDVPPDELLTKYTDRIERIRNELKRKLEAD